MGLRPHRVHCVTTDFRYPLVSQPLWAPNEATYGVFFSTKKCTLYLKNYNFVFVS